MNKPTKRILKITAIVVAVFVLSSIIATPIICRVVIDTSTAAEEYPVTDVYYAAKTAPRGTIILSPGIGDDFGKWDAVGESLSEEGFNVLTYYQGSRDLPSMAYAIDNLEKRIDSITEQSASDTDGTENSDTDVISKSNAPIILIGYSLGAYAVSSCVDHSPDIACVVSIYGFDNQNEIMKDFASRYVGILADIQTPLLYGYNYLVNPENSGVSASEMIMSSDTPVLVVANEEDPVVTPAISIASRIEEASEENTQKAASPLFVSGQEKKNDLFSNITCYEVSLNEKNGHSAPLKPDSDFYQYILSYIFENVP